MAAFWLPAPAAAATLSLQLGSVEHELFAAQALDVEFDPVESSATLTLGAARVGNWSVPAGGRLECPRFALDDGALSCERGSLALPDFGEAVGIDLFLDLGSGAGHAVLATPRGEHVRADWRDGGRVEINFARLALARLHPFLPLLAEWGLSGLAHGELTLRAQAGGVEADGRVQVDGTQFGSDDGLYAAENLRLDYVGRARWRDGRLSLSGRLDWPQGEVYFHPLYLEAGAWAELDIDVDEQHVAVNELELHMDGVRELGGRARYDRRRRHWEHAALSLEGGDLEVLGPRFIAPLIAPAQQSRIVFDGRADARLEFDDGRLVSFDARLDAARFHHRAAELEIGPVSGAVPWRVDVTTDAEVQVGGVRWQALELGGFEALAHLRGPRVEVEHIAVPVLDGRVVLRGLNLRRVAQGWSGSGTAVVEPISMQRLSAALGWPEMQGVFSASIPRLRVMPGELVLDGALVGSLFDGYVQIDGLRVLEPFGVASHMLADVLVRHLDLEQLTTAFAFGSMTGVIDADLTGLELVRWRPVRFDAEVRSSPGRYPRRISQRAVENIGALGGPGATLALQRGFLGFFDSFGYREIGLSCRLRGNVCEMAGIAGTDRDDDGFVIVRGGGLPALNVIGYNRRVDWPELVDRLMRVIESNTPPVIE